jgi:hypothetical protein
MGTKKVKPKKVKGFLKIAGEDVKIGSIEKKGSSPKKVRKAIDVLTEESIFPPPQYLNG